MKYEFEFLHGTDGLLGIIKTDFESDLLDAIYEIAKEGLISDTTSHEDLLTDEEGYNYLQVLQWFNAWEYFKEKTQSHRATQTDERRFDSLVLHFNTSVEGEFQLKRVSEKVDNRRNLLDLNEDEFVGTVDIFNDRFEFIFEEDYSKQLTIAEYLTDSSMIKYAVELVKDDDKDIERERSHYLYQLQAGIQDEENMKWFWFVLGDITQGFDSDKYKIYFL